ncbi:unnamed protein product [Onchocerca ochengi]|uniref:Uncharacterized protein n=2 Tax=Onchocerca TaxID=6281 RepID=A0A182ECU1_ONCOC|nr:unnamed protein product [Onchocerca ochengi]
MADDYEILDPNKAEPKFDSDSVPVTPILSSKQLSVIDQAIADKKNGEQRRKVILRKKDAEKMDNEYRSGSKLLDVKQGQGESDQFIIVYGNFLKNINEILCHQN